MKAFVVAISGLFLATGAFAQDSGEDSAAAGSEAVSASDRREETASDSSQAAPRQICRRMETATGSRMSYRRMCMTAEQWRSFNRSGR